MEQKEFELWVNNYPAEIKLVEQNLENNAIFEHILINANHDGFAREDGIREIAISYGLYKKWGRGLCDGRCFIM